MGFCSFFSLLTPIHLIIVCMLWEIYSLTNSMTIFIPVIRPKQSSFIFKFESLLNIDLMTEGNEQQHFPQDLHGNDNGTYHTSTVKEGRKEAPAWISVGNWQHDKQFLRVFIVLYSFYGATSMLHPTRAVT